MFYFVENRFRVKWTRGLRTFPFWNWAVFDLDKLNSKSIFISWAKSISILIWLLSLLMYWLLILHLEIAFSVLIRFSLNAQPCELIKLICCIVSSISSIQYIYEYVPRGRYTICVCNLFKNPVCVLNLLYNEVQVATIYSSVSKWRRNESLKPFSDKKRPRALVWYDIVGKSCFIVPLFSVYRQRTQFGRKLR